MNIGILTGGGDVPGLNPCIKAVVLRAAEQGHRVIGVRHGWGGLLNANPDDPQSLAENLVPLSPASVRTIDRSGGTVLHTSRTNPGRVGAKGVPAFLAGQATGEAPFDFTPHVLRLLEAQHIEVVIPIGGDDTLSYALRLHDEGVKVVAIPKTMDNDVHGTDYCIGFSTAVTRGVQFIHNLRTSTGSHERIAVIELFGRYSGETCLVTGYLAGVDRAVISEVPVNIQRLAELLAADKAANPSNYAMLAISEGAVIEGGEMVLSGRGGRLRPPQAGRRGSAGGRAHQGDHRAGHHPPADRLPDAVGQPRLARPHGRQQLRHHGRRPGGGGPLRAHGGAARWHIHQRAHLGHPGGRQAGRR